MAAFPEPGLSSRSLAGWKLLVPVVLVVAAAGVAALVLVRSAHGTRWQTHEETSFSVDVPADWSVSDQNGKVTIDGRSSEQVVIWASFVPTHLDASSAEFVARSLASRAAPDASWSEPSAPRAGVVQLAGESSDARAVATFVYAASKVGTAGFIYLTFAPVERFERTEATFARILTSFEPRGAPVVKASAPSYERWTDPAEAAFSVRVPSGWTTEGGTQRPSSLLVQASVATTSPDSHVVAVMTDALPLYVEPNDALAFGGIYEGGTYVDPTGYSSPVRSYAPGARYLTDYVLPAHAGNPQVTRVENRPDLARQLATYGINTYDAGEVEYRFAQNGVAYTGGAIAITERISAGGYYAWHVWRLFLTEAPSGQYGEGIAALRTLAGSFRIDPAWAARQSDTTRRQSGIIAQMSDDVSSTLSSGYWDRSQVTDVIAERRSRATLEVDDLTDEDGNTYRVDSGSDYYWIDPRGTIVGTDTYSKPDVDFRELVRVDG